MATSELTVTEPAAIVLNGGQSRRMGTDKATLRVDGVTLLERVLGAVEAAGITQVVVAGRGDVVDFEADQGPLGGIVAGWAHLQHQHDGACVWDPIVVLACDLPRLGAGVLQALVAASSGHQYGAVAHDGVRPQPLVAAYRPRALDELTAAYRRGERSVRRCSDGWNLTEVAADSRRVADADTPEDLRGFVVDWPA